MAKRSSNPTEKRGMSPYTKYRKVPYRYSDIYQRWRDAVIRGDEHRARQLSREHAAAFGGTSALPEAA